MRNPAARVAVGAETVGEAGGSPRMMDLLIKEERR
jgi:hypothetical protein